ncbi:hypothetical protein SteCoe_1619 [Stentor coeruleus]|uniref:chitin synthase n=1 Tax=Stentor coeruleus TaxID=5963 RepID=A0A1R2D1J7_9CILI|nr:hypothetical protein SteCoe_1619 [Stentor coeruleus]
MEDLNYKCVILNQTFFREFIPGKEKPVEGIKIAKGLVDRNGDDIQFYNGLSNDDLRNRHKFLVVVTMYNEPYNLLKMTLDAIEKNYCNKLENEMAVIVIADGIRPFVKSIETDEIEKKYSKYFNLKDIYRELNISDEPNRHDINKLLDYEIEYGYEFETQNTSENNENIRNNIESVKKKAEFAHVFYPREISGKMPVYFCVKQQNKRKLNSHLWYFGGFCKALNPEYCMLIDAGTVPEENSLFYLYKAMRNNPKVAGVCGEIIPKNDKDSIFDVLCYAQKVEYKFSHILDKALESTFGFITVLPGAFSGYRLETLGINDPDGPLWGDYFLSLKKPWSMDCYHANIYLAEDRVLCLALVSYKDYVLKYVSKSKATTDPPQDFASLLTQRRRWINGSWFALLNSMRHWNRIWKSEHHCCRKAVFTFQLFYYVINALYSFIMVGGFYLALSICLRMQLTSTVTPGQRSGVGDMIITFYLLLLILTIILSLGSNSKDIETTLKFVSSVFSIYMLVFIIFVVYLFFKNLNATAIWVPVSLTISGFVLILLLNNTIWEVSLGCLQFILATPTYLNIFTIYAICNIHDCTWGNRPGDLTQDERDKMDDFEKFRMVWVLLWALCNGYFSYFLDAADASKNSYSLYIYIVGLCGLSALYIRFIGGIIYVFSEACSNCRSKEKNQDEDSNLV